MNTVITNSPNEILEILERSGFDASNDEMTKYKVYNHAGEMIDDVLQNLGFEKSLNISKSETGPIANRTFVCFKRKDMNMGFSYRDIDEYRQIAAIRLEREIRDEIPPVVIDLQDYSKEWDVIF